MNEDDYDDLSVIVASTAAGSSVSSGNAAAATAAAGIAPLVEVSDADAQAFASETSTPSLDALCATDAAELKRRLRVLGVLPVFAGAEGGGGAEGEEGGGEGGGAGGEEKKAESALMRAASVESERGEKSAALADSAAAAAAATAAGTAVALERETDPEELASALLRRCAELQGADETELRALAAAAGISVKQVRSREDVLARVRWAALSSSPAAAEAFAAAQRWRKTRAAAKAVAGFSDALGRSGGGDSDGASLATLSATATKKRDRAARRDVRALQRTAWVRSFVSSSSGAAGGGGGAARRKGASLDLVDFREYRVDKEMAIPGLIITPDDLNRVSMLPFKDKVKWFRTVCKDTLRTPWERGHVKVCLSVALICCLLHTSRVPVFGACSLFFSPRQSTRAPCTHTHTHLRTHLRTLTFTQVRVRRKLILEDSFAHFAQIKNPLDFRKIFRFEFVGEEGIDAGGVAREWFTTVAGTLFNADLGLFKYSTSDNLTYTINPMSKHIQVRLRGGAPRRPPTPFPRTAPHRTASHRTASHRTASHRTASHRTAEPGGLKAAVANARCCAVRPLTHYVLLHHARRHAPPRAHD